MILLDSTRNHIFCIFFVFAARFVFAQIYFILEFYRIHINLLDFIVIYSVMAACRKFVGILAQAVMSRTATINRIPLSFHQWMELEEFTRFLRSLRVVVTPQLVERLLARQHWRFDNTRRVRLYHVVITDLPWLLWEVQRMQMAESQRRQPYTRALS